MKTNQHMNYETLQQLVAQGAVFFCNTSGGKDSQAMNIFLHDHVPASQIVLIHAHLPEVEWEGTEEHVRRYPMGSEVYVVQAGKTFLQMVEHRQKFPSAQQRQCTSDLKRAPIQKFIRNYMKERGLTLAVNCMGLRAQESTSRAKQDPFRLNNSLSVAGRTVYDWLPIHDWKVEDVWASIERAGQTRHWAYDHGMSRLSCVFCIMSKQSDLKIAAALNPELYARYNEVEERLGFTLQPCGSLRSIVEK